MPSLPSQTFRMRINDLPLLLHAAWGQSVHPHCQAALMGVAGTVTADGVHALLSPRPLLAGVCHPLGRELASEGS